jgi:hypothetical protein
MREESRRVEESRERWREETRGENRANERGD